MVSTPPIPPNPPSDGSSSNSAPHKGKETKPFIWNGHVLTSEETKMLWNNINQSMKQAMDRMKRSQERSNKILRGEDPGRVY